MKNDYIDAVIKVKVPKWQIGEDVKCYFPDTMFITGQCMKEEKTFTRSELESWLYENASNNLNHPFGDWTEDLIKRLDGFEKFVEYQRFCEDNPI